MPKRVDYFNRDLQNRVIKLFHDSLALREFCVWVQKKIFVFSTYADRFDVLSLMKKFIAKKIEMS
jgi:chemotaxis protein methyltransferase CheR